MTTLTVDPHHQLGMESQRRRSSTSIVSATTMRRASVGSLLMNSSRPPLAPLGPQMTPAYAFADSRSLSALEDTKARLSLSEDSLPHSGMATNMNNGSYSNSHTRLISTPARMQANYSSRRASLPAVCLSPHASIPSPSLGIGYSQLQQPADSLLFDQLQSYVLSGKKRSIQSLHDDKPRSDRAPSPRASFVSRLHRPGDEDGTRDSDDDDLARQLDRAKLRAIDDGSRRPSLPINIPPSQPSSSSRERVAELNVASSPAPKPLPDLPSSDPGPSATVAFDLNFIFGDRAFPNGPIALPNDQNFAAARRMSVSLDTGTDTHEWEDTFARFVDQNDREYSERRGEWTFSRQSPVPAAQDTRGIWKCGILGSYWVGGDDPPPPVDGAPHRKRPLVIRCVHPDKQAAPMATEMFPSSPSSAVRVHVHKHSRAPAYSLMLGNWTYLSPSRSSLLLAAKKVHLHVTVKKDPPTPPRRRASSVSDKDFASPSTLATSTQPLDQTLTLRSNDDSEDFRLPPRGYIPPYVNREMHEMYEMMVDHSGRSSNDHATAFTTLEPEVREVLLDQIRSRYTLGGRIKRVLGAGPPSPPGASTSHSNSTHRYAIESTYTPPWMLMAPGYLKEDNDRMVRGLQSSFETAAFFPAQRFKTKREKAKSRPSTGDSRKSRDTSRFQSTSYAANSSGHARAVSLSNEERARPKREPSLPPRNDVLESISDDTMCMAIPLWDFRIQCGSINGGQELPPPSARRWLFVTYVPFAFVQPPPPSVHHTHRTSLFFRSTHSTRSKKRPRNASVPASITNTDSSASPRSFRVVGRILTHHELRRSGMRHPTAAADDDPDYERTQRSASSEEPFSAVIAVCHDSRTGNVEYIPEGLDRLGLCGNAPQFVPGATTPFTFERDPTQLSHIGREVIEITWAGCLALMDTPT